MSDQSLYDEDILLWSEQQADVIRRLGRTRRDIPNELDIENVAEEIESVGRSELAAVKSFLHLIFIHLIKLSAAADSGATRHWRSEIFVFHRQLVDRYSPSMRQRIDMDVLWRAAREQLMLADDETAPQAFVARLRATSPAPLEDLLEPQIASDRLAELIRASLQVGE